jgi:hypothetical protein
MNEEAIRDAYNLFVSTGYTKSYEDFKQLINSNPEALNDAYGLFVNTGYKKDINSFKTLMGVAGGAPAQPQAELKKKDQFGTTVSPSAVSSSASQSPSSAAPAPAPEPVQQPQQLEEKDYFTGAFGDVLRGFDEIVPLGIGDFVDDMARSVAAGYGQAQLADEAGVLALSGSKATPEEIQKFIEANKNAQQLGQSKEAQEFNKIYNEEGGGFWGVVKGLALNPSYVPEIMTSSLVSLATNSDALMSGAAAIGTGATYGAATGAAAGGVGAAPGAVAGAAAAIPYAFGLANGVVEAGSYFAEELQNQLQGKEMTKENVKAILENPEKLQELRNGAITRGLVIGAADALTGKLASKVGANILSKSAAKSATGAATKAATTGAVAAGSAIEAAGGSAGEVAARAATGQEMDTAEILLEGIAELPGGVRSTIQARLAKPEYKVNGAKVSAEEVDKLIATMTPAQLQKTKIDIKNDYEGRQFKIQDKIVTDAIKTEVKQANPDLNNASVNAITQLEKELRALENNKTQVGKDKVTEIKSKIKDIQENQLPEEVEVVNVPAAEKPTEKIKDKKSLTEVLDNIDDDTNGEVAFLDENDVPLNVRANSNLVADAYFSALEAESKGESLTQSQQSAKLVVDQIFGAQANRVADTSWANDLDDNTEYELNFQSQDQIPTLFRDEAVQNEDGTFTIKRTGVDVKNQLKMDTVNSFNDNQMYTFDFNSMEEVPDEYRGNVREIPAIEGTTQRRLLGIIPIGKEKKQVFKDKVYRVSISGVDAKKLNLQPQRAANKAQVFRNTAKSLASIFPDVKIVSVANENEMKDYALQNFNQDVADTITGAEGGVLINDASGKPIAILINEETAVATTMPHEAWHAILVKAFGENPALFEEFKNGIEKALRDNGMTQIIDALDNFSNQEEYINSNMQAEEWLVELGGLLTSSGITYDNLTPKAKSLLTQIKAVFNAIAVKITGQPMFLEDATPEDMLDFMVTISDRMARGMSLNEFFRDTAPSGPAGPGVSSKTQRVPSKQKLIEQARLKTNYFLPNMMGGVNVLTPENYAAMLQEFIDTGVIENVDSYSTRELTESQFPLEESNGVNPMGLRDADAAKFELEGVKESMAKVPAKVKKQVPAYHGSPYDFDKFATEKIGTGEGAQAYGWGLYFTDLKDIAENYANQLSEPTIYIDGKEFLYEGENKKNPIWALGAELLRVRSKNDLLEEASIQVFRKDITQSQYEAIVNFAKTFDSLEQRKNRNLYNVTLHEGKTPDQYTWLEWDKPMSDRALELFQKFNKEQGIKLSESTAPVAEEDRITVGQMYKFISNKIGQKEASLFLLKNGIDGIKYPAEYTSRGATSETARGFNYVVFDENAVTIKNKVRFQRPGDSATLAEVKKIALRYNMNDRGFIPKTASEVVLARELAPYGYGAKRSKITPEGYGGTVYMTNAAGKFFNPFTVKKHRISLSGGKLNPNVNTIEGYDRMMDQVQTIIDKSERRGVAKDKIMENVMEYVTKSKVYERANDSQREQLVRNVETEFGKAQKSSPSVGKILGTLKDIKKITLTEKELLKQHFRDLAKGARDAKRAFMQASDDLSLAVSELAKSGKISPKQLSDVIRKFSKVNMLNEDSTNAFVDYMTKVFEDADYAQKIAGIRTKITKARGNLKSKIGVADAIANPMRKLLAVNPTLIPDDVFDKYINIVNMFSANQAVLPLKDISDISQDINDIFQSLDEQLSKSEELAIRFDDFADKVVNEENGKIQYADTVNKMEKDGIVTAEEAELMKKYKSVIFPTEKKEGKTPAEIQAENNTLIKAITDAKMNLDRLTLKDERELADNIRRLLKPELLKQLTTAQLTNLIKLIDNINNGFMPHYGMLAFERLNAIKNSTPVGEATLTAKPLPVTQVYNNLKSKFTKKGGILEMVRSGGFFFIDQVFGNFKTKPIFNALFEKISEAQSAFTSALGQVNKKLDAAHDAVAKSFAYDANKTLESSFRMMAYMIQLEYDSNPGNKQVNPASAYIKETIKAIKRGKTKYGDAEIEMLQRILDKDGNVDKDALYNSFNNAEKNAIKTIREINDGLTEKAVYTAAVIRGQRIDALNNYVHLPVMSEYNPDESAVATQVANNYNNNLNPSTKGKNLIERTAGAKAINFDVFASAQRGAKFTLLDYHMTTPIRTARKTLNEVENRYGDDFTKQQRDIFNAIRDGFEEVVSDVLTNNFVATSTADEVVNFISKQGYRVVLGSAFRFVAELKSNLAFVTFAGRKAFAEGVKYFPIISSPDAVSIMDNVRSKQTTRLYHGDTLSGRFIDQSVLSQTSGVKSTTAKGVIANKANQIYNMSLKKYKNSVELIADTLISTPDRVIMRPVWFGQFATEFKKQTGKDVDFKKIADNNEAYMRENKDAIEAAKLRADEMSVLAGATDNPFMGMVKGSTKPNQSVLLRAFNNFNTYMTRFAMYEYTTARQGIYAAMGKGSITRKEGIGLLAAVTARMTVYTLLTNMFAGGLAGLLGDEEEEDEKTLMQKLGQSFASTGSSLLLGRNFGNATKMLVNYGVEEVNEEFLDFLRNGDYDPYKDAISFSAIPKEKKAGETNIADFIGNMSGSFSPAMKTTNLIIKKAFAKEKKEPEAIKRSEEENMIRIPLEVLGNMGMVPLYKDVRREVMNELYKDLRNADKKAEDKKQAEKEMLHGYENKEDMKRYDPELYDEVFGKDSPGYDAEQAKKKLKHEADSIERRMKDEFYEYVPKKKKGGFGSGSSFGSESKKKGGFGSGSGFGSKSGFGGK